MKKIYISSYYQWRYNADMAVLDQDMPILQQLVDANGTMVVSLNNLKLINTLKEQVTTHYYQNFSDYIIQLYSDLEVAFQEIKLSQMAASLGYECHISYSGQPPKFRFIEEDFPAPTLDFDTIEGDIFVINTHGKPSELDGEYNQALSFSSSSDVKRIVIDACSSACSKSKNTKSIIEMIAIDATRYGRASDLEIVGYKFDFTPVKHGELVAKAIFARKELILSECEHLTILVLGDYQTELERAEKNEQSQRAARKFASLKRAYEHSATDTNETNDKMLYISMLRELLIEVSSKALNFAIYEQSTLSENFLKSLEHLCNTQESNFHLMLKNAKTTKKHKETLKNTKNTFLQEQPEETLLQLALMASTHFRIDTFMPIQNTSKDMKFFLETLSLLDDAISQLQSIAKRSKSPKLANQNFCFWKSEKTMPSEDRCLSPQKLNLSFFSELDDEGAQPDNTIDIRSPILEFDSRVRL